MTKTNVDKKYRIIVLISIALISFLMHYQHFSKELMSAHVWRQTQTQSTIISFYEEDMNILNPRKNERGNGDGIFRMEFPLMQWMVAALYKMFGNHLVITRLFMFITGLFTVAGMYKLLSKIFCNDKLALVGAWAFNFSPTFYYYTINPLPDNFALCCSVWGLALFFAWYRNRKLTVLIASGLLLATGTLCKLPFILYYAVPFICFFNEIRKHGINKNILINAAGIFGFLLLPVAWYSSVVGGWQGNGIVQGIFDNKVPFSTILDYLLHNLVSTLPELLLNYGSVIFFVAGFYFIIKRKAYKHSLFPAFVLWSLAVLAYFLFEINMIEKVHDYYLFPFYPMLFILVGYGAWNIYNLKNRFAKYFTVLLLCVLPLTAWLRMHSRWDAETPGFNKDLLLYKDELRAAVPKNALCVAGNDISHFIFFYYVDKKGWVFDSNNFNASQLNGMIEGGAKYLYTDSREIDGNKNIQQHFNKLIFERGSIRVYSLK